MHSTPLVKPKEIRPLRDLYVYGATIFLSFLETKQNEGMIFGMESSV